MKASALYAHKNACTVANRKVPEFKLGSKEHEQWLREYDKAVAMYFLLKRMPLLLKKMRLAP